MPFRLCCLRSGECGRNHFRRKYYRRGSLHTGSSPMNSLPMSNACCKPFRRFLHSIRKSDAKLTAVSQQIVEARGVLRRRDDQNVPDPRQHQGSQGVVDHGLVIYRAEAVWMSPWSAGIVSCRAPPARMIPFTVYILRFLYSHAFAGAAQTSGFAN